jgi:indole-3-glycerol phosphate synthase
MTDFLQDMATSSRERAAQLPDAYPDAALERPSFPLSLDTFDIIAEIKNTSPAEGVLVSGDSDRKQRAHDYAHGGAAAISVLTEPSRFAGDVTHLEEVAAEVASIGLPVMRKDFLVDTRQIAEARACGASGVLLIAAMLSDRELASMLDCAFDHSLFVLLESFDSEDLSRSINLLRSNRYADAAAAGQLLVGINTRNLRTLQVNPTRLERLSGELPTGVVAVAESGQTTASDAARVAEWGYSMALVGTALMRSSNPGELIADMRTAGRERKPA